MPDGGYDAFISYNHEADGPVGPALRDGLHLFARPWNRLRALRVFCDRRAMDPAEGLWTTIRQALDASRFLILVASPGAAGSSWVGREVDHWRQTGPRRPILIVRTAGEIVWDPAAGDFDWERTTALPRALSGWFTEEPQWVDLPSGSGGLSLRDPAFQDAVATLAASLHGRPKEDLLGEDVRQHRSAQSFRRAMWAALSVVALVAVGAAVWASAERSNAIGQRDKALASSLVSEARTVQDTQPGLARQLLATAHDLAPTPQAKSAVVAADEIPRELTMQASALAYDADGTVLAVARSGRSESGPYPEIVSHVWLYDAETLEVLHDRSLESHEDIPELQFAADGLLVLSHGDDILVMDVSDPRAPVEHTRYSAPSVLGNVLDVAPDGQTLAAGSRDGTIRLWSLANPADEPLVVSSPCTAEDGVHQVRFARSGSLLATGCGLGPDATLKLWNVGDPRPMAQASATVDGIRSFEMGPDGRGLVAETDDGLVHWGIASSGDLREPRRLPLPLGYGGYVSDLAYGERGRVAAVSDGGFARVWDVADDPALLAELPLPDFDSANSDAMVFAPGARALVVGSRGSNAGPDAAPGDGTVRIWHVADPLERRARASIPASDAGLAVGPDGRTLAGFVDGSVYVADVSDPLRPEPLAGDAVDVGPGESASLAEAVSAISPDGDTLAIAREGTVDVVDISDRAHPRHVVEWPAGIPQSVAFRPDGDLLAVGTFNGAVHLYDLTAPDQPQPAGQIPTVGFSLAFLPDRPVVAVSGGFSSRIELWDVSSTVSPRKLSDDRSHTYQVSEIDAARDGLLASAARDSSVRTWRVDGDRLIEQSVVTDSGDVNDLVLSASGTRLATLGRDETLRVYRLDDGVPTLDLSLPVAGTAEDLVGFVGENALAVQTTHGAVDIWDLDLSSALERLCSGTGKTITEQQWNRVLPDISYDPPC